MVHKISEMQAKFNIPFIAVFCAEKGKGLKAVYARLDLLLLLSERYCRFDLPTPNFQTFYKYREILPNRDQLIRALRKSGHALVDTM